MAFRYRRDGNFARITHGPGRRDTRLTRNRLTGTAPETCHLAAGRAESSEKASSELKALPWKSNRVTFSQTDSRPGGLTQGATSSLPRTERCGKISLPHLSFHDFGFSLDEPLLHHCAGHLQESGYVRTVHVIARGPVGFRSLPSRLMNVFHDLV